MKTSTLLLLWSGLLASGACLAQSATPTLPALPPTELPAPASKVPEPNVLHGVTEDDNIRIDELRVRGQTQRITVQPKIPGMPSYEILPRDPSKAPGQDAKAGQRVWFNVPLPF